MKKPKRKIRNNLSLHNLLYSDKFIMCFSIFAAFVLWIVVSSTSSDPDIKTVTDISINIPELSDNLQVMSADDVKAEVRVKGNKLIIGSIQSSDILISADVSDIDKPGEYKLKLSAKKQGLLNDYEFDSTVTPSTIDVYVDRNIEKTFDIEEDLKVNSGENYLRQEKKLSNDTVKVSGAETIINKIASVKAEYETADTLTRTTSYTIPLTFYDENGKQIISDYISPEFASVEVTVPILKVKKVPIKVEFTNIPDSWEMPEGWIEVSTPENGTIQLAASDDIIDSISEVKTEPIDLSKIFSEQMKVSDVLLEIPASCTNVDRVSTATLSLNMDNFSSKEFAVTNVELRSEVSGVKGKLSGQSFNVTIVGPTSEISRLKASDITLYANLTESESTAAFITKPLQINIEGYKSCWWNYAEGENNATFTLTKTSSQSSGTSN